MKFMRKATDTFLSRSIGKHSNLSEPKRLNRVDLYGYKSNSYGEVIKSGGPWSPWSPVPMPMFGRLKFWWPNNIAF